MRRARAPRPLAIRLFAAAFVTQALLTFYHRITHLAAVKVDFSASIGFAFDRDLTIVLVSALLTIALIPVALVWQFANRLARWFVLAMTAGRLLVLVQDFAAPGPFSPPPAGIVALVLSCAGAALLFTPSANRWFAARQQDAAPPCD